jgi:hypothetical protein
MTHEEFHATLHGHATWLERFRAALQSGARPDFIPSLIRDHNACALGHWLLTHKAPVLEQPQARETLNALHQTFHEIAAEIAEMIGEESLAPYLEALDSLGRQLAAMQELRRDEMLSAAA